MALDKKVTIQVPLLFYSLFSSQKHFC